MNILPKKNWHVRKKENIARVRKDEAEAAEKQKEIERRAKCAEQEARLAFLRSRANVQNDESSITVPLNNDPKLKVEADIYTSSGNINFFKEAESGSTNTGTNKEYEEEKKKEKEEQEKKIGLLTYLGQDTFEATGQKYWYADSSHIVCNKISDQEEVSVKSKANLDPLNDIIKYTGSKPLPYVEKNISSNHYNDDKAHQYTLNECFKKKSRKKDKRKRKRISSDDESITSPKKTKSKHKHKKRKKRKKKISSPSEDSSSNEEEKQKKMQKLREERLKREAHEHKRQIRLLAGKNPDVDEEEEKKSKMPFQQKYNTQFNPHLAKQNQRDPMQSGLQSDIKYWLK